MLPEDTPSTSKPATEAVTSSAPVAEMDKKFIVKHKYEAAQKDELQLKPGDIVQMLEDVEPGWALGKVIEILCPNCGSNDVRRQTKYPSWFFSFIPDGPSSGGICPPY